MKFSQFNARRREDTVKILLAILGAILITLVFNPKGLFFFIVGCMMTTGIFLLIWLIDGMDV